MRLSPTPGKRTAAIWLLAVLLVVAHIATAAAVDMLQSPLQLTAPSPHHPHSHAELDQRMPQSHIVSFGGAMLDRLGRLLGALFPNIPDESEIGNETGGGGLFGDGDGSLAWGGSTLEVVKTQASYLTRPATFGPRIVEEEGLRGVLLPISDFYTPASKRTDAAPDNHGCPYKGGPGWRDDEEKGGNEGGNTVVASSHNKPSPPKDWIALVERGGKCSFVSKVRVAQALGAKAVVVGDAPSPEHEHDGPLDNDPGLSGRLVTMFAPGDTSDVVIPSTFIKRPSYVDLIRLVAEIEKEQEHECVSRQKEGKPCSDEHVGVEVILWRDDVMWEWPLIDLAFVLLMLPSFMTLITIIVHRVRMIQQRRKERAPEEAVLNLPCLIWRPHGQPWEKVEDATIAGGEGAAATGGDKGESWHAKRLAHVSRLLGRLRRRSQDMELGDQVEPAAPAAVTDGDVDADASNEAGPSTAALKLKTTPVAPPQSTPERTYYGCDECAICLSDFVDGELVRVLPCGHVFHLPEIDSWLCKVKKLCPVCKRDITVPVPPNPFTQPAVAATAATATTVEEPSSANVVTSDDESTPLLGGRLV